MVALCTVADVDALSGYTTPPDQVARVERLIEMASAIVSSACIPLPTETPDVVVTVTAQVVVRQLANPAQANSEQIGQYRVKFEAGGMGLSDADYELLGSWAKGTLGRGAYSVWTPNPFAVDDVGYVLGFADFSRDDAWIVPFDEQPGDTIPASEQA